MPIVTGSTPKALMGAPEVAENGLPTNELMVVAERFMPKQRKPPKIKKHAFGEKQPGAAFRK